MHKINGSNKSPKNNGSYFFRSESDESLIEMNVISKDISSSLSSTLPSPQPPIGSLDDKNLPNKRQLRPRVRNPYVSYNGYFKVECVSDKDGYTVRVLEHEIPGIGVVYLQAEQTGEVKINRYKEGAELAEKNLEEMEGRLGSKKF